MLAEPGETHLLMQMPTTPDETRETPVPQRKNALITAPDFANPLREVAELVTRPDFPQCALGEFMDMGGFTGVAVEIVNQSLKVRSPEGATRSFNIPGLRRRYNPPPHAEAVEKTREEQPASPVLEPEKPEPSPREKALAPEPDFNKPLKPIADLAVLPDFPQCALGELLDLGGFIGVALEIVSNSLKVRSPEGATRSFNIPGLRRRYTPVAAPYAAEMNTTSRTAHPTGTAAGTPSTPPEGEPLAQPDFEQQVKPIRAFAGRRDFPECALGELVDVRGYSGVLVQIIGDSLKVRSPEGEIRTFDAEVLRKLYGRL